MSYEVHIILPYLSENMKNPIALTIETEIDDSKHLEQECSVNLQPHEALNLSIKLAEVAIKIMSEEELDEYRRQRAK